MKLRHIQKIGDIYKFTVYENDEEYYSLCTPECADNFERENEGK